MLENKKDFGFPTRQDILPLFKNKFERCDEFIECLLNWIKEPFLTGLDYTDVAAVIENNSSFEFVNTNLKELPKYQKQIDKAKGIIFFLTLSPKGTLVDYNDISEKYFSKTHIPHVVGLCNIKKEIPDNNPKIDILLAK